MIKNKRIDSFFKRKFCEKDEKNTTVTSFEPKKCLENQKIKGNDVKQVSKVPRVVCDELENSLKHNLVKCLQIWQYHQSLHLQKMLHIAYLCYLQQQSQNVDNVPQFNAPYVARQRHSHHQKEHITIEHYFRVKVFFITIDKQLQELSNMFSEQVMELLNLGSAFILKDSYKALTLIILLL
ncbi:hypothetical protein CR513_06514, partial [Mucuna pruriens]